ncbi:MAG: FUSC family protein [Kordia sp.]|nr:MAG: FUSC family protein [Kordia sp.]
MQEKELSGLTDKELLEKSKNMKSAPMTNAILIGFLVGIIVYSIWVSSLGFFTLIPLFFIYKLIDNSKKK